MSDEQLEIPPPSEEIKIVSMPSYTLYDRADQLEKFQVVFLSKSQVKEFEELFLKKEYVNVKEPLYKMWVLLKFAAAGTEEEAIDWLLTKKVAKNVKKRQNKRKDSQPSGPARYDPSSPEWVAVLTEQQANKKTTSAPKRKAAPVTNRMTSSKKQKKTSNKENESDLIK